MASKIVRWNSERGFGFVSYDGQDIFLHVTAIEPRQPRGVDLTNREVEVRGVTKDDKGLKVTSAKILPVLTEEAREEVRKILEARRAAKLQPRIDGRPTSGKREHVGRFFIDGKVTDLYQVEYLRSPHCGGPKGERTKKEYHYFDSDGSYVSNPYQRRILTYADEEFVEMSQGSFTLLRLVLSGEVDEYSYRKKLQEYYDGTAGVYLYVPDAGEFSHRREAEIPRQWWEK